MIEIIDATFPLLTLMVALPAVGALAIALVPGLRKAARPFSFAISVLVLVGAIALAASFNYQVGATYQFAETYSWVPALGLSWALGVNGVGLAMVVLAALLTVLVIWANQGEAEKLGQDPAREGTYLALVLVLEAFMILIFAARDVLLFYLAFEAMLVPVYFMVGSFGREGRSRAALKFLLYSLAGGLVMLIGIVGVFVYSPDGTFLLENVAGKMRVPAHIEMLLFLSFFFAFAVKAPMVPVHTWLADTAEVARPGTSTLLVGILDKIGTFGMITLCLTLFPHASARASLWIIILAIVSVLWGGFAALGQKDLMRLVSFTSVSHFGLMVMAIFVGNATALTGAMVYMVAHGLSIAGMFLISGFLTQRVGTQEIAAFGGFQRITPVLAGTWLISGLAALSLPGLSGFPAEFMVFMGSFHAKPWAAAIALLGVILAALYILVPYQRIFTGPPHPQLKETADLDGRERAVVGILIAVMLLMGFFPKPLTDIVAPTADTLAKVVAPLNGGK
ncbi:MAG: NADH-quinone oxidoreductase subunit M [Actinomycetaceae bacterium]|nr:NADH-quinone oxidoreductase subunit M [Actinomycetaceae bacterium]